MNIANSPVTDRAKSAHNTSRPHETLLRGSARCPSSDSYRTYGGSQGAGRPPAGQGFLTTLLTPFAPQRRRREDAKEQASRLIGTAIQQMHHGELQACHQTWRAFTSHCLNKLLAIDRELRRGAISDLHPLEEILQAGDYEALVVLAPALKAPKYGDVFVYHLHSGFYIGEGVHEGNGKDRTFKAHGRGILVRDGYRTEGEWSHDMPNGLARFVPTAGPLRCYEGQVKDGKIHGRGRVEFADGRVLRCSWANEVRDGHGEMSWPNGDRLTAVWKDGVIEPGAIFETQDGLHFVGDIDDETCRPHGNCVITWQSGPWEGASYEGPVTDGVPNGQGTYTFGSQQALSGFIYEGPFFKGDKHGLGTLVELFSEKKQRCHFVKDVLKTPEPQRTEVASDDESDD